MSRICVNVSMVMSVFQHYVSARTFSPTIDPALFIVSFIVASTQLNRTSRPLSDPRFSMDLVENDSNSPCDTCKRLCTGHWCLKPYDYQPDASHWVQVENLNEDVIIESRHHVIKELLKSTQKGCRLCAIIQGMLLPDEITKFLAKEDSSHQNNTRTTYELETWGWDIIVHLVFHSPDYIILRDLLLTPTGGKFCRPRNTSGFYSSLQSNVSNTMHLFGLHGNALR